MLFSVNLFAWLVFHKTFSPQIFVLLSETNCKEATEFVKTFLLQGRGFICLFVIAVMMSMIILTEKSWPIRGHRRHFRIISSIILVCSLLGFFNFDIYYDICKSHTFEDLNVGTRFPYDTVMATALALHDVRAIAYEMKHAILLTKKEDGGHITETDSLHVILVIGESYIKSHAQIYGYYLPTTPYMMQEKESGRLITFNNVVTPKIVTSHLQRCNPNCAVLAVRLFRRASGPRQPQTGWGGYS